MPYVTERGVTSYYDHDTPLEYATGADEERAQNNDEQDAAVAAAEKLMGLLDDLSDALYEPQTKDVTPEAMKTLREQMEALVATAETILGRSTPPSP